MVRISKSPLERKREILQVSLELFMKNGYENTSIGDIVKKVGVAQGLFYYYFKSKEEVYQATLEFYTDAFAENLQEIILDRTIPLMMRVQKMFKVMGDMFADPEPNLMGEMHKAERMDLHNRLSLHMAQSLVEPLAIILNECNAEGLTHIENTGYAAPYIVFGVFGIIHGTHETIPDLIPPQFEVIFELIASTLGISKNALMQL